MFYHFAFVEFFYELEILVIYGRRIYQNSGLGRDTSQK
nr:MAG TPA: hypothetical protein [Caudoviricetes sp.]